MRLLTLALVLMAASSARAESNHLRFDLALDTTWVLDDRYDFTSSTDVLPTYGFGVAYSLPGLEQLSLRAGYAWGTTNATSFRTWTASFSQHDLQLGALWFFPSWKRLTPFASAQVLVGIGRLTLTAGDQHDDLSDTAFSPGARAAAGLELALTGEEAGTPLAVLIEAGWTQRFGGAHFDGVAPNANVTDPARVAFVPMDLGTLSTSGPFLRVGVTLRR